LIRSKPEERDHAAIEAARRKAATAWTVVEDALEATPFLAGPELTLAEIVMGTLVYRWHAFPVERPPLRRLKSWYERMRERPAFKTYIEIPIT
jgi:glutathione S-transferase